MKKAGPNSRGLHQKRSQLSLSLIKILYQNVKGNEISLRDRDGFADPKCPSLTYGEIVPTSFFQILSLTKGNEQADGREFVDLGCGTGKCVVTAAFAPQMFSKCWGIEIVPALASTATSIIELFDRSMAAAAEPIKSHAVPITTTTTSITSKPTSSKKKDKKYDDMSKEDLISSLQDLLSVHGPTMELDALVNAFVTKYGHKVYKNALKGSGRLSNLLTAQSKNFMVCGSCVSLVATDASSSTNDTPLADGCDVVAESSTAHVSDNDGSPESSVSASANANTNASVSSSVTGPDPASEPHRERAPLDPLDHDHHTEYNSESSATEIDNGPGAKAGVVDRADSETDEITGGADQGGADQGGRGGGGESCSHSLDDTFPALVSLLRESDGLRLLQPLPHMEVVPGDIFAIEWWRSADVAYAASLLFSEPMMLQLAAQALKMRKGSFMISLRPLPLSALEGERLRLVHSSFFKMSWQMAKVYIYEKGE